MTCRPTAPISLRLVAFTAITVVLWSSGALAQTPTTTPVPPPQAAVPTDQATRPATTTFFGDTGLWYVPTAEVLARGRWSASAYRRGTNYIQGYTNVGDVATTFAYGLGDRAELFGSFLVVTRIDRDTQPLFFNDVKVGGIVERYPGVTTRWSGNNLGDLFLGAKVSLLSERTGHPVAVAVRGMVKLPTGDVDAGVSTGRTDTMFDVIASKEVARAVEISGFGGYEFRGNAEGFDLPAGAFRWGTGAAFPTRFPLRGFAELSGVLPSSASALITSAALLGPDGSRPPQRVEHREADAAHVWSHLSGQRRFLHRRRAQPESAERTTGPSRASEGSFTDYTDWQLRFGYHPGQRARALPAAPQMAQAAPAAALVPAVQPPPVAPTPPTPTPAPPAPVSVPVGRAPSLRVPGRVLRLRPLDAAGRRAARPRWCARTRCGQIRRSRSRSRVTPATSGRLSTTSLWVSGAPMRSAATSSAVGWIRAGSEP